MSEEYLVRNCAPTLAGLKTVSLFTCPCPNREALLESLRKMNRKLRGKGLRVVPLRFSREKALIYLYRPSHLARDLSHQTALGILRRNGYTPGTCEECLCQLMHRLRRQEEFPHEIGLFLGYPPEDVEGFMTNRACNCKCTGCWKVYGDEAAARKKFAQYRQCTQVYCRRWAKENDIERLAVAG